VTVGYYAVSMFASVMPTQRQSDELFLLRNGDDCDSCYFLRLSAPYSQGGSAMFEPLKAINGSSEGCYRDQPFAWDWRHCIERMEGREQWLGFGISCK